MGRTKLASHLAWQNCTRPATGTVGIWERSLSNLVFTTGGFSSGSTLLFTLLRKTEEYYCLYEPLHERLREHLHAGLRVYEHHYHVDNYFAEYRGFTEIDRLSDPLWGNSRLALSPSSAAPDLYRYLSYLIGTGFGRHPKVMLKFNRAAFRLGWLRAQFPQAKVVHIYRDCAAQWTSTVRRAQAVQGTQDVGQDSVKFNGMNIARWCDDLSTTYPELAADRSKTGYERFSKLWELSRIEGTRYADLTISYEDLTTDFENICPQLFATIGSTADWGPLKRWVVSPEEQTPLKQRSRGPAARLRRLADRARFEYAKMRVRMSDRDRRPT